MPVRAPLLQMSLHNASTKQRTIFNSVNSDYNERGTTQTVSQFRNRTSDSTQASNTQCCICNSRLGILIQCTGPCHRYFHLPDEQSKHLSSTSVLILSQIHHAIHSQWIRISPEHYGGIERALSVHCVGLGLGMAVVDVPKFQLPLSASTSFWFRFQNVHFSYSVRCDVTSCPFHFCQNCISTFQDEVIFNGVFICPDHYCYKCRSIIPINDDQTGLLHCPICSRSCHSICLDDLSQSFLSQGVMICPQHCLSPQQYWSQLVSDWKGQLSVDHPSSNPNKRLCGEATDLSSVLGPKTGLEGIIKTIFKEERSKLDPEAFKMKVYPPYDTVPTIPSDEEINAFHELLKFPTHTTRNELTRVSDSSLQALIPHLFSARIPLNVIVRISECIWIHYFNALVILLMDVISQIWTSCKQLQNWQWLSWLKETN